MFTLSKWYLDCITNTGDVSIAYTGELTWGEIRLHYSSVLESTGSRVTEKHSLRQQSQPQIRNGLLHWDCNRLKAKGEWKLDTPTRNRNCPAQTIFRSPQGSIAWHCLAPNAAARLGNHRGLGYAEHLTLDILPWKLPIQILRWGRFTSDSHSLVWIDWQGESAKRLVFANGETLHAPVVEDTCIKLANGARLTMDCSLVLRDGPLGTAALSRIPGIQKTLPARLLLIRECKWRSRGRLEWPGEPAIESWAIHERVEWPE
jgi:hypothetical protein